MFKKYVMVALTITLPLAVYRCEREAQEATETVHSQSEEVIVPLARWQQQVKGEMLTLSFSDLRIVQRTDKANKKISRIPCLKGGVTILNHSNQILDVREINVQFLNKSWDPIPFRDGEKKTDVSVPGWSHINPGEQKKGFLSVKVPKKAVEENASVIQKIRYEITYLPLTLKREALDISRNRGAQ